MTISECYREPCVPYATRKIEGGNFKYYVYAYVVVPPFSAFPIDMLRYDTCSPRREVDSGLIIDTTTHQGTNEEAVIIEIERLSETKKGPYTGHFTWQRWKSFGVYLFTSPAEAQSFIDILKDAAKHTVTRGFSQEDCENSAACAVEAVNRSKSKDGLDKRFPI